MRLARFAMLQATFRTTCVAILWLAIAAARSVSAQEHTIPKPLPDHPGNVFLAGEEVTLRLPDGGADAWRCVDFDGQVVAQGRGTGAVHLGRLPVGYYEVQRDRDRSPLPSSDSKDATHTRDAPFLQPVGGCGGPCLLESDAAGCLADRLRRGNGIELPQGENAGGGQSLPPGGPELGPRSVRVAGIGAGPGPVRGQLPARRFGGDPGRCRAEDFASQPLRTALVLGEPDARPPISATPSASIVRRPGDGMARSWPSSPGTKPTSSMTRARPAAKWPPCKRQPIWG